jgi:hypothetical protein
MKFSDFSKQQRVFPREHPLGNKVNPQEQSSPLGAHSCRKKLASFTCSDFPTCRCLCIRHQLVN